MTIRGETSMEELETVSYTHLAATAVDMDFLERAGRGKEQHLLAYAMERERLEKRLLPLKEAGISCARLSVLPDCMAKFALRMGARRQTAVMAALESDQLRLCLVKDGHCLLNRNVDVYKRQRVELPQTESALETGTPAPSMVDI